MVPMGRVYRVTVHHTAHRTHGTSRSEAIRSIRLDQRYHMGTKRWGDIGYHYLIDAGGRVWQGRDVRWQGAHAGNGLLNRGNIGVCLLGNFTSGAQGQAPSAAQVSSLQALVRHLRQQHRISISKIFTHREMPGVETVCPGPRLQSVVDRMRRRMVAHATQVKSPPAVGGRQ